MVITEQQLADANIKANAPREKEAIKKIVNSHTFSERRKNCIKSREYYRNDTDIRNKRRFFIDDLGQEIPLLHAPNTKISHNYHRILIDLDVNFCFGKEPSLKSDNSGDVKKLFETVNKESLYAMFVEWSKEAEHNGVGWVYPFVDRKGDLNFKVLKGEEIVPFYDELTGELIQAYRIYKVINTEGKPIIKIQVFNLEGYYTYLEHEGGYELDSSVSNPTPYLRATNEALETTEFNNWGFVPLLPLRFNEEEIQSLSMYKDLIDDKNQVASEVSDAIKEKAFETTVITGYVPTRDEDKSAFKKNVKQTGFIFLDDDGGATTMSGEIPTMAVESHLTRVTKDLFVCAMSVDLTKQDFSNLSGEALKFMYKLLDLKIDGFEPQFKKSFNSILETVNVYRELKSQEIIPTGSIKIKLNRNIMKNDSMIVDDLSKINNISNETRLEINPYITDVDQELKRQADELDTVMKLTLEEDQNGGGE